ncbi:MAG TPA: single-stranded DNA-binding protein [Defluviitoga sp.]|nr:single-stranded DNA-binding protein [Defluviitoga sp.]HOP23792.1 single-stranded DNA-binding protein [Defluviitoga sp.]HPZ28461.1 single-stranded DNA-binding protein [Defluviitoga sp.]HQD62805.1 single-stranded DNA-binding protein [Defluviitoga sp.]
MSISYNKVILVGRLTKDPEIRSTVKGDPVATFRLAVDRQFSSDQNATDFINIVAFGKQAEFASNYLKKGKLILVEGSLRINQWTDRDNIRREKAEVWANRMNFMETKKAEEERIYSDTDIIVEESARNIYDNNNFIENIDDATETSDYELPDLDAEDLFGLSFDDDDLDKDFFSEF